MVSTATAQPEAGLSRTEQIVARVERELRQRIDTHPPQNMTPHQHEEVIAETLAHAWHYGDSLNRQSTLGFVTCMIQAVTVHALARLGYPLVMLPALGQFMNDIGTLVCAPNQPSR